MYIDITYGYCIKSKIFMSAMCKAFQEVFLNLFKFIILDELTVIILKII